MGWWEEVAAPRGYPVPTSTPQQVGTTQAVPFQAPGVQPSAGGDYQQQFLQLMGGGMATPEGLIAKETELAKLGIKVLRNASGVAGKVQLPSGEIVDVIQSAGTGGGMSPFQWQQGRGGPTGEGGKPLPGNQFYGQPMSAMGAIGAGAGTLGGMLGGTDYGARLPALEKTPGYQFRFDQGRKAIEGSAAAKGTLLTGGAAKDLTEFGQGLASTEFDNEYRRLFGLAGLGQGAAGAIGAYGSSYGDNATNLLTGQGDSRAAGTLGSGNAWGSALGGVGQTAMDAWMYNQMLKPKTPYAVPPTTGAGAFGGGGFY